MALPIRLDPSATPSGRLEPMPAAGTADPELVAVVDAVETPTGTASHRDAAMSRIASSLERAVSLLRIVAILALLWALWWCQVVLIPLVLSVVFSYALEPLVARLESWHLRRSLGVPLVMLSTLGLIGGTTYALRGEVTGFVARLPEAAHRVSQAMHTASRGELGTMGKMQAAARELESAAAAAQHPSRTDGITAVRIEEPTFKWSEWMWSGSRNVGQFAAQMFAVLCLTYYLLAAGDLYRRKLVHLVPTLADKRITVQILEDIDRQIERFLMARAAISLVVAIVVWIAFRMLGVENAGVWAVLSAFLFAIPIVGPTAFVVAVAVAGFFQFASLSMVAALVGVCVVIAAVEGNMLTPWFLSVAGEMSSIAVFVSLLFWGWMWGLWGVLLAVPITAAMKALAERIPEFNPIAEFLKK